MKAFNRAHDFFLEGWSPLWQSKDMAVAGTTGSSPLMSRREREHWDGICLLKPQNSCSVIHLCQGHTS